MSEHGATVPRTPHARGDGGAASLAVALLTPVFVVLLFAAVQAALWGHARTETRVAARDAAAQVARFGADTDAARTSAHARLAGSALNEVSVVVSRGSDLVVVTITGSAPGILVGTSRPISVTEAVPVERIVE